MKKFVLIMSMMLFCLGNIQALEYKSVDETQLIPAEYAFTPKFIAGENGTKVTKNLENAIECDNRCVSANDYLIESGQNSSNIYVLYQNVGKYNGQKVDLKITFQEITFNDNGIAEFNFNDKEIGVSLAKVDEAKFKFEYLDHETHEMLNIKSVISYSDIDGISKNKYDEGKKGETIGIEEATAAYIYVTNEGFQHFDSDDINGFKYLSGTHKWTGICGTHDGDSDCGGLGDGTFQGGYDGDGNELNAEDAARNAKNIYNAGIVTTLYNSSPFVVSWRGYYLGVSRPGFLDIEETSPVISVDEKARLGDEIVYTIIQGVPNIEEAWHYKDWSIETNLSDKLDVKVDNITIVNNGDNDVTDKFDISIIDNKLVIKAKDDTLKDQNFYNDNYTVTVKAKINENAKSSDVITVKAVHLTTSAANVERSVESDEVSIKIVSDKDSDAITVPTNDNNEAKKNTVSVPSTAATISVFVYIVGAIITISGIVMYVFISQKLKKQNENN